MFCCLTASTARALLSMTDAALEIQVIAEAVVACPEPDYCVPENEGSSFYFALTFSLLARSR